MSYRKELLTAAGTLTCALGIGFIMQSGDAARERYGNMHEAENAAIFLPPPSRPAVVEQDVDGTSGPIAVLKVQDIALTSAEVGKVDIAIAAESPVTPLLATSSDLKTPVLPEAALSDAQMPSACGVGLTATPVDDAMVKLTLVAPCNRTEVVTVSHLGLELKTRTDSVGKIQLEVPALAKTATFDVRFSNGKSMSVTTMVPDLDSFDRTVLISDADAGLHLHAREFGAAYGQPGHVWAGATGEADGASGILTTFDLSGAVLDQRMEIYTIERQLAPKGEKVAITIETEISARNCGREVSAQVLSRGVKGETMTTDVSLSIPGCDAAGGFLVLNYPPQDLTVAAR